MVEVHFLVDYQNCHLVLVVLMVSGHCVEPSFVVAVHVVEVAVVVLVDADLVHPESFPGTFPMVVNHNMVASL